MTPHEFTTGVKPRHGISKLIADLFEDEVPDEVIAQRAEFQQKVAECEHEMRRRQEEKDESAQQRSRLREGCLVLVAPAVRRKHDLRYKADLFILESLYNRQVVVRSVLKNPGVRYRMHRKYVKRFVISNKKRLIPHALQDQLGGYVSKRDLLNEGVVPFALEEIEERPQRMRTRAQGRASVSSTQSGSEESTRSSIRRAQNSAEQSHTSPEGIPSSPAERSVEERPHPPLSESASMEDDWDMQLNHDEFVQADADSDQFSSSDESSVGQDEQLGDDDDWSGFVSLPEMPQHGLQSTESSFRSAEGLGQTANSQPTAIQQHSPSSSSGSFHSASQSASDKASTFKSLSTLNPESKADEFGSAESGPSATRKSSHESNMGAENERETEASSSGSETGRLSPARTPPSHAEQRSGSHAEAGNEEEPIYEEILPGIARSISESIRSILSSKPSVPSFEPGTPEPRLRRSNRQRRPTERYTDYLASKMKK